MSSIENTRVLIAGINQFINTVISYINISNRDFKGLLGQRTTAFSDEEGRVTYALIVEGLLGTTLKNIDTRSPASDYPTSTSVAELLFSSTTRGLESNAVGRAWIESFEMMEVYGISFSDADPRVRPHLDLFYERYIRPAVLRMVFEYIAMSITEFRGATRTC